MLEKSSSIPCIYDFSTTKRFTYGFYEPHSPPSIARNPCHDCNVHNETIIHGRQPIEMLPRTQTHIHSQHNTTTRDITDNKIQQRTTTNDTSQQQKTRKKQTTTNNKRQKTKTVNQRQRQIKKSFPKLHSQKLTCINVTFLSWYILTSQGSHR